MDIVLTHMAALQVMRNRRIPRQGCSALLPSHMPSPDEMRRLQEALPELKELDGPIGVLVSSTASIHATQLTVAHTSAPLPQGALVQLAPGVRCVSPLMLPVLMSRVLKPLELQMLLAELMGLYSPTNANPIGLYQRREPLATLEEFDAFLQQLEGAKGAAKVQKALRNAPVLAASPQEAKLFLRVTLPYARGGYNLKNVVLNDTLSLKRISSQVTSLQDRKPDLLFQYGSSRVCLDYMGAWHDTESNARRDTQRRNELLANGFKPYEIYKRQYDDLSYMDGLMHSIRSELGLYRERPSKSRESDRWRARRELWRDLEAINPAQWVSRLELR